MKTNLFVLLVSLLILIPTSSCLAEETPNDEASTVIIDDTTQKELKIMVTEQGAEIRLLQLEEAVVKKMDQVQYIISFLENESLPTLELQVILAELQLMQTELYAIDPASSEAAAIFVAIKTDARELTEEFKELLHKLIDDKTIQLLQEALRNVTSQHAQRLRQRIHGAIITYNTNQFSVIYSMIGGTNHSLLQSYRNGTCSLQGVKQQIHEIISLLNEAYILQLYSLLKGNHIRRRIQTKSSLENITCQYQYQRGLRLQNRMNASESIENDQLRCLLQQRLRMRLYGCNGNGGGHGGNGMGGYSPGDGYGMENDQGENHGDGNDEGHGSGNGNTNHTGGGGP